MTYAGAYKNYARIPEVLELPRLSEMQLRSFEWFRKEGLAELLAEISPIVSLTRIWNCTSATIDSRSPDIRKRCVASAT